MFVPSYFHTLSWPEAEDVISSFPSAASSSIASVLRPGGVSVCSSAKSVGRPLPRLLLPLPIGAIVVARDEAPDGLEVALVYYLEHNQVVSHLMDRVGVAGLLAEVDQEDGEAVEFKSDLAHVVRRGVGDVKCDFGSSVRRHAEHAGVRLEALAKDGLGLLSG